MYISSTAISWRFDVAVTRDHTPTIRHDSYIGVERLSSWLSSYARERSHTRNAATRPVTTTCPIFTQSDLSRSLFLLL